MVQGKVGGTGRGRPHGTPGFPVRTPWHRKDVHAFWGPSIHWNTYLNTYVILMNYAIDRDWTQGGIYISFNHSLTDPRGSVSPNRSCLRSRSRMTRQRTRAGTLR